MALIISRDLFYLSSPISYFFRRFFLTFLLLVLENDTLFFSTRSILYYAPLFTSLAPKPSS